MTEIWFIEVGKSKACHNFMGRQTLPSIFESHLPGNTPERIPHSGLSCPRCLLGKEEERKRLYSAGTIHACSINPLNPGTLLTLGMVKGKAQNLSSPCYFNLILLKLIIYEIAVL